MKQQSFLYDLLSFVAKAGVVVIAGLLLITAAAFGVISPLASETINEQIFTVRGEAKRYVSPDLALITIGTDLTGQNPATLQQEADKALTLARDQIIALGVEKEQIRTSQYNLSPVYDVTTSTGTRTLRHYQMLADLEIRTKKLDLVGKVVDIAVANKLNRTGGVQYLVDNQDQIDKELREEAVEDAEAQAKDLAKASGLKLGKVLNVLEGEYYTPYPGALGRDVAVSDSGSKTPTAPEGKPTTTINPGQTEVRKTVTVYYQVR